MNACLDKSDSRYVIFGYKVGDCVTEVFYTDRKAGRVVEVKRNGKEVIVQEDTATLDPNWKPDIISGGFAGHCVNQHKQTYTYTPNPEGRKTAYTLRTWRGVKVWTRKNDSPAGRNALVPGSRTFYDYNF